MGRLIDWIAPYKWLAMAAAVLTVVAGLLWYRASLINDGRAQVQAQWDDAIERARLLQAAANATATTEYVQAAQTAQTVYRDRIKEVIKYVPIENTSCPVDPEFERLYNAASAAGQPGAK